CTLNMGTYSDSTSDLDDDLPVFDFLQPAERAEKSNIVDINDCDAEVAAISSTPDAGACRAKADVMMISSDSDDNEPYVPLATRLKQRPQKVLSASSAVVNEKDAENCSPSNLVSSQVFRQKGFSESDCLLSQHQVRTVLPVTSSGTEDLPQLSLKPLSGGSSGGASSAKKKPAKWTVEEIQAKREEALRRKEARERKQQDKEALRQEQDKQKAERNAAKALRPEECIKHMVVAIDPAILQLEGGGTLLGSVQALGCICAIEKQPLPRSVSWMRRTPCAQPGDAVCVPEAHVVMQMTVDDFITLIHSYVQRHGRSDCGPTLTSWVGDQQRRNPGKILSLVVIELEKFFRSQKSQNQKRFREAVQAEETRGGKVKRRRKSGGAELHSQVSQVEVEEAVLHLQLHTGVSVRFLSSWKDFSDHITMTTKAIAETPFKRAREKTGFSFYLESEWAGGQRVDKAGKGLLQVWKRQIQQLNRVSRDMAATILAAYPSPQLLKKVNTLRTHIHTVKIHHLYDSLSLLRGENI
uniref:Essential meiotic structure-specific endonuclease 1 n=1 Tax=Acanthochromis polyacanthus TaxID=80966 RepID=A0A3Q1FAR1_9TELE